MAPVAGRTTPALDAGAATAIVADTGGTSYDVSLVRRGRIPWTRETWLGEPYDGHITGFPSVDVKSIGAGGGSIAWVDDGGLLHVGPQQRRRRARARPATGAAASGRRSPTPASCSATSTPTTSSAARCALDAHAARRRRSSATSARRSA